LWQLSTVEQLNLMLAQAKMLEVVLPDGGLLQIHRLLQVFKTNVRAMWDYEPQPYPGQIILYKAAEMATPDEAESVERAGLTLGWERFSARPVKVHTVPGDHYTMLTEPHVQVLAGQLRAYLDQAQ
jgi:thioesterase domain-containing protein